MIAPVQNLFYHGITARVIYNEADELWYGKLNCSDLVTFEGESLDEATAAFREAADDYLEELTRIERSILDCE